MSHEYAGFRTPVRPPHMLVTTPTDLSWFPLIPGAMALVRFMLPTMTDIPCCWNRLCSGIAKRDKSRNLDIPHAAKPAVGIASSDPMTVALEFH